MNGSAVRLRRLLFAFALLSFACRREMQLRVVYTVARASTTPPAVTYHFVNYPGRGAVVLSDDLVQQLSSATTGEATATFSVTTFLGCAYDHRLTRFGGISNFEVQHTLGLRTRGSDSPFGWCD